MASAGVFKPGAEGLARSVGAAPLEVRGRNPRQPPRVLPSLLRACVPGGPVPPGSAAPGARLFLLPSPQPRAPPRRDFSASLTRREGGRPPARAPSLPAPSRRLAALPSGCVPAAPGGRRPGGSAASEDLPPPGIRTRAAAAPFPAGAPGAPAPLPLQAAAMDEKYLPELMAEKDSLDPSFTHALRLVNQGEGRRGTAGAERGRFVERRGRAGVSDGRRGCSVRGSLFVLQRSVGFSCVQAAGVYRLLPLPLARLRGGVGGVCPAPAAAARAALRLPPPALPVAVSEASWAGPLAGRASPPDNSKGWTAFPNVSSFVFFYNSEGMIAHCLSCKLLRVELLCRTAWVLCALLGL